MGCDHGANRDPIPRDLLEVFSSPLSVAGIKDDRARNRISAFTIESPQIEPRISRLARLSNCLTQSREDAKKRKGTLIKLRKRIFTESITVGQGAPDDETSGSRCLKADSPNLDCQRSR